MAANPQYAGDPISAFAVLATANLNRDGVTGAIVTAYTFRAANVGGKGGRLDTLTITAGSAAVTVAGNVLFFVNNVLLREIAITAITPTATVKGYLIPASEGANVNGVLILDHIFAPGDVIKFLVTTTQALTARVTGGEY